MKNPIAEFAKTAIATEPRSVENIKAEREAAFAAHGSLLGIEREAKASLENQVYRLNRDLKFKDTGYKRLSLEPLTWTKNWGGAMRPIFAVYTLTDPVMTIRSANGVRNNGGGAFWHGPNARGPELPTAITDCYTTVQQNIPDRIKSTFMGVIPPEVKEAIRTATPLFEPQEKARPDIFVIAEGQWVLDHEPVPPPRKWDPLVVGWDGRDLWLIAHFDLTSLEAYMIREFPALGPGPDQLKLPEAR